MPVKNIVVSMLQEKQAQLMKQYEYWEELQNQAMMDRADSICEKIRRMIYELEELE